MSYPVYIVSKSVLYALYSVRKCPIDSLSVLLEVLHWPALLLRRDAAIAIVAVASQDVSVDNFIFLMECESSPLGIVHGTRL